MKRNIKLVALSAAFASFLMAGCSSVNGTGGSGNSGGSPTNPSISFNSVSNLGFNNFTASAPLNVTISTTPPGSNGAENSGSTVVNTIGPVVVSPVSPTGNASIADCSSGAALVYPEQFSTAALSLTPVNNKIVLCAGNVSAPTASTAVTSIYSIVYTITTTTTPSSSSSSGGSTTTPVVTTTPVTIYAGFTTTTDPQPGALNTQNLYIALAAMALRPQYIGYQPGVYNVNGSNGGTVGCLNTASGGEYTTAPGTGVMANPTNYTLVNCETQATDPLYGLSSYETSLYKDDTGSTSGQLSDPHSGVLSGVSGANGEIDYYSGTTYQASLFGSQTDNAISKSIGDNSGNIASQGYFLNINKTYSVSQTQNLDPTKSQNININDSLFVSNGSLYNTDQNGSDPNGGNFDYAGMTGATATITFNNSYPDICIPNYAKYNVTTLNSGHASYNDAAVAANAGSAGYPLPDYINFSEDDFIRFTSPNSPSPLAPAPPMNAPYTPNESPSILGRVFISDRNNNLLATITFGRPSTPPVVASPGQLIVNQNKAFEIAIVDANGGTTIKAANLNDLPPTSRLCDNSGVGVAGATPATLFYQQVFSVFNKIVYNEQVQVYNGPYPPNQ